MVLSAQEVIEEIQRVARVTGKGSVSWSEFDRHGRFTVQKVLRLFRSWNSAVAAAGLTPNKQSRSYLDEDAPWRQRVGEDAGAGEATSLERRVPGPFEKPPGEPQDGVSVLRGATKPPCAPATPQAPVTPSYGRPSHFRALRHEPMVEQGVVLAFGMAAEDLGFLIEAVRRSFPDCIAKRRTDRGEKEVYKTTRIEFEFRSSAFRAHRHDAGGCDLIVCWEHDWPECPIEVLELKVELARLAAEDVKEAVE